MTAEQKKAKELIEKFGTKEHAILCVDEIIENCPFKDYGFKYDSISSRLKAVEKFWQTVKQEIINYK